jgi:hypothetical protein
METEKIPVMALLSDKSLDDSTHPLMCLKY